MDLIIFAVFVVHFVKIGNDGINDCPLNYFWILCDLIIMFISLPYAYKVQLILVKSEVTKNVFTLFQKQKKQLRKRRDELSGGDKEFS